MLPIEASDNYKAHHERPSSDEPDMDEPEVERRPRKRRKKDLSKLPDMPLDILFEVWSSYVLRIFFTSPRIRFLGTCILWICYDWHEPQRRFVISSCLALP